MKAKSCCKLAIVFMGHNRNRGSMGSILGPFFFLIYINELSNDLPSNPKLFADDTSLFRVVKNMAKSVNHLNNDLAKICTWGSNWKMKLDPDQTKQAKEVIFSQNPQNTNHSCLIFTHKFLSNYVNLKNMLEKFWILDWILRNIWK